MRDVGIRTAMYGRVLFVALGLVAAVGTAVVYLIGGNLAVSGTLTAGTIGAFVIYVGQIYQPLAQLSNARVDVITTLVSFERVFEVLDFPPAIVDEPAAETLDRRARRDRVRPRLVPAPAGRGRLPRVARSGRHRRVDGTERMDPARRLVEGRTG